MLSEALGYWCFSAVATKPLRAYDGNVAKKSLFDVIAQALEDKEVLKRVKQHSTFGDRVRSVQKNGGCDIINRYVETWKISNSDGKMDNNSINVQVKELRTASLYAFMSGGGRNGSKPDRLDFFLCHGVTSAHSKILMFIFSLLFLNACLLFQLH